VARLGREDRELRALGALATASEIVQQPAMLRKTHAVLVDHKDRLERFLRPLLDLATTRVILAGAGTSAFIGECLAPSLAASLPCRVEAIPTTDLVCAPHLYFQAATPTLLVSFARSGDSPESVAAVALADQLVSEVCHLAITCNPEGALARRFGTTERGLALLLPAETHDRGFAMTSSFTSMMYAGLAALCGNARMQERVDRIAQAVEAVIATQADAMKAMAAKGFARAVYLGSHIFKGLAQEAALKLIELTDGEVIAVHDSPLGFRHGPKTIVNAQTLVGMFLSNNAYTRRYDIDLLAEIARDGRAGGVLAISARDEELPAGVKGILIPGMADAQDVDLLIPFIAAPQLLAFEAALGRGLSPDRPNVSGTVNRVVRNVRIHTLGAKV
jgi:tagatose-6-phosphate ketose/aldose isomerase